MTRSFLMILLLLSSRPAYVEWVAVSRNVEAGMTVYIDPDTIRRKGDLVKLWALYDFKTVQTGAGNPYLSFEQQSEYDCTEERMLFLASTRSSGNMGNGNVTDADSDEAKWTPVSPRSLGQSLWKVACGKK